VAIVLYFIGNKEKIMPPIQEQLQANFTDLKNRFAEIVEQTDINNKASIYVGTVKRTIRKHPIPSLIAGLALGFIIGKLLSDSDETGSSEK